MQKEREKNEIILADMDEETRIIMKKSDFKIMLIELSFIMLFVGLFLGLVL